MDRTTVFYNKNLEKTYSKPFTCLEKEEDNFSKSRFFLADTLQYHS